MAKIYISGKVSGLDAAVVRAKFRRAETELSKAGWNVVNPMKIDQSDHDGSWANCMIRDLQALSPCDAIYMLGDWFESRGAKIELEFAYAMGKMIFFEGIGVGVRRGRGPFFIPEKEVHNG